MQKHKGLSLLLALVMVFGLSVPAMAAGGATRLDLVKLLVEYADPERADGAGLAFADCADLSEEDKSAIATAVAQGWASGTSETTFDPNGILLRWQAALLLDRIIPSDKRPGEEVAFTDIEETPAKGSIEALGGIVTGTSKTTFSPDEAITREDLEQWLKNAYPAEDKVPADETAKPEETAPAGEAAKPEETAPAGETAKPGDSTTGGGTAQPGDSGHDWQASSWAQNEVEKADKLGLIPESLADQDLTKPISRAEFAAVSVKVYEALSGIQALPAVANPFTDCADVEVLKAYNLGVTTGTGDGTTFSPADLLNREQAATMLTRTFKRVTMPGWSNAEDGNFPLTFDMPVLFADDGDISSWARDSVYFMAANSIIQGNEGKFMPRAVTAQQEAEGYAQTTREQALLIAVRMVENLGK